MAIPIFLTISMYIGPTRLLKVDLPNVNYNFEGGLRERYTNADWSDYSEIKEAIAADNNENNDEKDS